MDFFYKLDLFLLHVINVDWADPIMDQFWLTISHLDRTAYFFWVLLLVLLVMLYIYRARTIGLLAMIALSVGVSDAISTRIIKPQIDRPRPFQNQEISDWLRKVDDAHGPSCPSNHAANCFAGASILAWYFRKSRHYFYIFAGLVAYSRVYLGVHYPSDVVGGAILGITVGILIRGLLLNRLKVLWLPSHVSKSHSQTGHWRTRSRRLDEV